MFNGICCAIASVFAVASDFATDGAFAAAEVLGDLAGGLVQVVLDAVSFVLGQLRVAHVHSFLAESCMLPHTGLFAGKSLHFKSECATA